MRKASWEPFLSSRLCFLMTIKPFHLLLAAALRAPAPALTAETTWHGTISDSNCGASHKSALEHGSFKTDAECTTACVKGGAEYVFVSKGKVYKIANQDAAGLAQHAGHDVALTGTMSGDTITVATVTAAHPKKS
jgi:hypothetical protein